MELFWCVAALGLVKICKGDFFSDLDKLDIDTQLREIDDMIEKLDDDSVFDDVLNTVDDLSKGDCKYGCKKGAKPVPREGHVPKSNGCGSFGIQLDTSALPQMTKCCDAHDHCYDTCNKDRDQCDNDFKKCLDDMCEKLKPDITKNQYEGCKETANLIYGGTTALGCAPYLTAQEKACQCQAEESGSKSSSKTGGSAQGKESKSKQRDMQKRADSKTAGKESEEKMKDKTKSQKKDTAKSKSEKKSERGQNNNQRSKAGKSRLSDEL